MSTLEDLTARVAALDARLHEVEAVLAIERLKARYAALVDARYTRKGPKSPEAIAPIADEIAATFSRDGEWDGGALGVHRGRAAIAERMRAPTLHFSWHFFVKPEIEVAGDTARGRWDLFSPCTTADGVPMWMTGVEHDTYVREEGEWLHRSMKLEVVFMAPYERGWAPRPPGGGPT